MLLPFIIILTLLASAASFTLPRSGELHIKTGFSLLVISFIAVSGLCWYYPLDAGWHVNVLSFGRYDLALAFGFDVLTRIMSLVVILISVLLYAYARRYLLSDLTRSRFLTQLCLVSASVLILVMSGNLLTAFIGWQLIGLNLYLLLNHYHYDLQANTNPRCG